MGLVNVSEGVSFFNQGDNQAALRSQIGLNNRVGPVEQVRLQNSPNTRFQVFPIDGRGLQTRTSPSGLVNLRAALQLQLGNPQQNRASGIRFEQLQMDLMILR